MRAYSFRSQNVESVVDKMVIDKVKKKKIQKPHQVIRSKQLFAFMKSNQLPLKL